MGSLANSGDYLIWTEFDLSTVAETTQITSFESAKFVASQGAPLGAFYPNGTVSLARELYGDITMGLDLETDLNHGTIATSSTAAVSKDITSNFFSRWQSKGANVIYQLAADGTAADGAYAVFSCTGFSLELVFLAP